MFENEAIAMRCNHRQCFLLSVEPNRVNSLVGRPWRTIVQPTLSYHGRDISGSQRCDHRFDYRPFCGLEEFGIEALLLCVAHEGPAWGFDNPTFKTNLPTSGCSSAMVPRKMRFCWSCSWYCIASSTRPKFKLCLMASSRTVFSCRYYTSHGPKWVLEGIIIRTVGIRNTNLFHVLPRKRHCHRQ